MAFKVPTNYFSWGSNENRKKEVENLINVDKYEECEGCPYLQRFEKSMSPEGYNQSQNSWAICLYDVKDIILIIVIKNRKR